MWKSIHKNLVYFHLLFIKYSLGDAYWTPNKNQDFLVFTSKKRQNVLSNISTSKSHWPHKLHFLSLCILKTSIFVHLYIFFNRRSKKALCCFSFRLIWRLIGSSQIYNHGELVVFGIWRQIQNHKMHHQAMRRRGSASRNLLSHSGSISSILAVG